MSVSLCIPYRQDGAERDRNWLWLRARYERQFDWEIVEADCEGTWSKGAAVNRAVEQSSGDILVIADADVMVAPQFLAAAITILPQSSWVVPHGQVWRMNKEVTEALVAGTYPDEVRPLGSSEIAQFPLPSTPGGAITVMWRKDWLPMDERFLEWGAEDISHGRLLDTLVGKHRQLPNLLWHLHHEPMPCREGRHAFRVESEELALRYWSATGDKDLMTELMNESCVPS